MFLNEIIEEDLNLVSNKFQNIKKLFINKNILLVGSTSFILSYFIILLVSKNDILNCNIFFCVRNKKKFYKKYNFINFNSKNFFILNFNELNKLKYKYDFIIHAASQSNSSFIKNPVETYEPNILWTHELLKIAQKHKSTLIFFSSGEIYGNFNNQNILKINDTCLSNPLKLKSIYPDSKRLAETMCMSWSHEYNVKTIVIRLFHTYGPFANINDGRIFSMIMDNLINKKIFTLNNLTNKRCFCYATDFLNAFLLILSQSKENFMIYNLANIYQEFSIKALMDEIKKEFNEFNIKTKILNNKNLNEFTIKRARPDISNLVKLGWKPEINVRQGFRKTYNYYISLKKNRNKFL